VEIELMHIAGVQGIEMQRGIELGVHNGERREKDNERQTSRQTPLT
jgi:hypothetical protein